MMRKLLVVAGTALAFGLAGVAFAQTALPEGVTDAQMDSALKDLSAMYGAQIVRLDQAKAVCNEEKYVVDCAEIGKKHNLFSGDRAKQVGVLLSEFKGDAIEKMKACEDAACLVDVAASIASRLNSGNPSVARAVELTPQKVKEKKTIVDAAKSLGVDIEECRTMDPDTASIELLRGCARLAKHENVQKYIPQETKNRANEADAAIALKESLTNGQISCGDNTLEGCGNFCLVPSPEARAKGSSAIPEVCRQIASKFFGDDGVKGLENAYSTVQNTFNTFADRAQNIIFTTTDGRTLSDPGSIGRYMEEAGSRGDVDAVSRGMDFLVAKGFVTPKDKDFAFAMVKKVKERGPVDFGECRTDPSRCADLISEEDRGQFTAMREIEKVMMGEMGKRGVSDSSRCSFDPSVGQSCLEAARAALPQIELLAKDSPQVQAIVSDIRQKIRFGEAGMEARARVEERFKTSGDFSIGGQRFGSINDLEVFCRTNPQQCLTETAREGIFSKDVAAERYEHSIEMRYDIIPQGHGSAPRAQFVPGNFSKEEALQQFKQWLDNPQGPPPMPPNVEYRQYQQYPTPYSPYPRPPLDQKSCQYAASMPAPCKAGEYRQESINELGCPVFGSCIPLETKTEPPQTDGRNICPALPTVTSCPAGEEKMIAFSSPECGTYYSCRPVSVPSALDGRSYRNGIYFSSSFMSCMERLGNRDSAVQVQQWLKQGAIPPPWGKLTSKEQGDVASCERESGQNIYDDPNRATYGCERYGSGWHSMDSSGNCFNQPMTEYRTISGALNSCATAPAYGCGSSSNIPPPPVSSEQREQVWNSLGLRSWIRSDADPARIESLKGACANVSSRANVWLASAGTQSSPDFGMPDSSKCAKAASCPPEQYFDGAACSSNTSNNYNTPSCGSNEYWNGSACVASATQTNTTATGGCSSELIGLLGSGCHSMGNGWFNAEMTQYVIPNSQTVRSCAAEYLSGCTGGTYTQTQQTACPSGQYWNGSSCVTSTTQPYCPSGQYVNGACAYTSSVTTCPSGQYWNGSACATTSSTDCPSGQYWNGSACVSSTQSSTGSNTGTYDTASAQQACTSAGGTWDSSANYCRMPTTSSSGTYAPPSDSSGSYTPPPSTSGSYTSPTTETTYTAPSSGSYTPPPTTTTESAPISYLFCPDGHDWNGAYCTLAPRSPFERYTASVWFALSSILGF